MAAGLPRRTPAGPGPDRFGLSNLLIAASSCLALLAGRGVAEAAPAGLPAPVAVELSADTLVAESDGERVEAEPAVEERWKAPFAVTSRGRPTGHDTRSVVVLDDSPGPRLARPADAERAGAAAPEEALPPATAEAEPALVASEAEPASARPAGRPTPAPAQPGPTAAATKPAAARPAAGPGAARTHRVERGETWYGIARKYRIPVKELAAANPEIDPGRIRSGQTLRIPGARGTGARPAEPVRAAAPRRVHKVETGETLWRIARRYGVSMEAVRRANRLEDDRVRVGQSLVIPVE